MYEDDSFFTLTTGGQIGLLILSASLALLTLWVAWRVMRRSSVFGRLVTALVAFALFVWLSPQVYYTYYLMIFDGLPLQWVIGWPVLRDIVDLATFTGPANMSAHSQGLLFWVLVLLAIRISKARAPQR